MGVFVGCCGSYVNPHEDMGGICVRCHNERIKQQRKQEENKMRKITIYGGLEVVVKEDYLKIVEEKERLEESNGKQFKRICGLERELEANIFRLKMVVESSERQLKEKEEKIGKLIKYNNEVIENNEELRVCITETGSQNDILQEELEKAKDINIDLVFENKGLKEHIEVLTKIVEEQKQEITKVSKTFSDFDIVRYKNIIEQQRVENEKLYEENVDIKGKNNKLVKILDSVELKLEELEKQIEGEREKEEYFTLWYTYKHEHSGEIKRYEQNNLLEDEVAEMFGMDSDNWIEFGKIKQNGFINGEDEDEDEECGCCPCCECECDY